MKKIYVRGEGETNILYTGIEALDGGYMMTTGGDPTFENEYLDAITEAQSDEDEAAIIAELEEIRALVAEADDIGEDVDEQDIEYINEWLYIWGLR